MLSLYQVSICLLKKINTKHLDGLKLKNLSKGAKRDIWSELMQELKVIVFLIQYYPEEY